MKEKEDEYVFVVCAEIEKVSVSQEMASST